MAFRLSDYSSLIESLLSDSYELGPVFSFFENGLTCPKVFLRHDVDRLPFRAVQMAEAEHSLGVSSTYYFRCDDRARFPEQAVNRIAELSHEVGYHYETVTRAKGNTQRARELFEVELASLRQLAEVKTISAHGSPFNQESNMGFSLERSLADYGLLGESSVDMDFKQILYVTDTGGMFGSRYNVRDRVDGKNLSDRATPEELAALLKPNAEPFVLVNTHPERWPQTELGYFQAALFDFAVNCGKRLKGC